MVRVYCVGAESLGQLRGRVETSMKGVANLPGRKAGLYAGLRGRIIGKYGELVRDFLVSQSWSSRYETSLGWVLSFGVADEESWESLSENSFRVALTTALAVGEEAFVFPFRREVRLEDGGCRRRGRGLNPKDISHGWNGTTGASV